MSEKQLTVLFRHFVRGDSITTLEAMRDYGICRLSERIRELEQRGWIIDRVREESNGKHFVRYSLSAESMAKAA
jgi:hypothetical protein